MVDIYEIFVDVNEFESVLDRIKFIIDDDTPVALGVLRYCNIKTKKLNIFTTDMMILKNYILYPSSNDIQLLKTNGVTVSRKDGYKNQFIFIVDINHYRSLSLKRKLILNEIIES